MLEVIKKNYKRLDIQKYTLYLWAFCVFFPQLNFVGYIFIGMSFIKIISQKEYINFKFSKDKLPYIFLLLFIIWNMISLSYSVNLGDGIKQIEKKLPLLLISIVGLLSVKNNITLEKVLKFYLFGTVMAVFISILYTAYMFFYGHFGAVALVQGISSVNFLEFFEHRLYIGIMLLMVIPFIFRKVLEKNRYYKRIVWSLLLCVLCYLIYVSESRMLVVSLLLVMIVHLLMLLKSRIKRIFFLYYIFLTIALISFIVSFHPRTRLTIDLIQKNKEFDKIDHRFITWQRAIETIKNNFWIGVGVGDAEDELLKSYKENKNYFEYENRLNVHNQYLQTGVETGIIGVVFFILFLGSLIVPNNKKTYRVTFLIVFGSGFLIESILCRNLGTFPLAFWIFVLTTIKNEDYKEFKRGFNFLSVISLGCGVLIAALIIAVKFKKFNSIDPSTYMTAPFMYIKYKSLPNYEELPRKTSACLFIKKNDFSKFESGYFLAPEIYSTNIDQKSNVTYGIWCFVSKDSNIRRIYSYAWDRINQTCKTNYDLSKKGSWQYLRLENCNISKSFSLGIRMDLYKETSEIEGEVFFALPSYKINYERVVE